MMKKRELLKKRHKKIKIWNLNEDDEEIVEFERNITILNSFFGDKCGKKENEAAEGFKFASQIEKAFIN
jgi:hypothetical protein